MKQTKLITCPTYEKLEEAVNIWIKRSGYVIDSIQFDTKYGENLNAFIVYEES